MAARNTSIVQHICSDSLAVICCPEEKEDYFTVFLNI